MPRPSLPPVKTRYPLYRRLGGPQGRSGRAENLVPTGIQSRTVQPVVSRYTDWATRPTKSYPYVPNSLATVYLTLSMGNLSFNLQSPVCHFHCLRRTKEPVQGQGLETCFVTGKNLPLGFDNTCPIYLHNSMSVISVQENVWNVKRQSMEIKPNRDDVHSCSQTRVTLRCHK